LYSSRKCPYSSDGWALKKSKQLCLKESRELSQNLPRAGWGFKKKKPSEERRV